MDSCSISNTKELGHIMEKEGLISSKMNGTVFLFWSMECPLCLNYSKDMNELETVYKDSFIQFVYVFSGEEYKNINLNEEWNSFVANKKVILDTSQTLTKTLKATVTPEVIVVKNKDLNFVYSGKIDNWIVRLGQKRQVVDSFYLKDALIAISNNEKPKTTNTTPVGCYIEQ